MPAIPSIACTRALRSRGQVDRVVPQDRVAERLVLRACSSHGPTSGSSPREARARWHAHADHVAAETVGAVSGDRDPLGRALEERPGELPPVVEPVGEGQLGDLVRVAGTRRRRSRNSTLPSHPNPHLIAVLWIRCAISIVSSRLPSVALGIEVVDDPPPQLPLALRVAAAEVGAAVPCARARAARGHRRPARRTSARRAARRLPPRRCRGAPHASRSTVVIRAIAATASADSRTPVNSGSASRRTSEPDHLGPVGARASAGSRRPRPRPRPRARARAATPAPTRRSRGRGRRRARGPRAGERLRLRERVQRSSVATPSQPPVEPCRVGCRPRPDHDHRRPGERRQQACCAGRRRAPSSARRCRSGSAGASSHAPPPAWPRAHRAPAAAHGPRPGTCPSPRPAARRANSRSSVLLPIPPGPWTNTTAAGWSSVRHRSSRSSSASRPTNRRRSRSASRAASVPASVRAPRGVSSCRSSPTTPEAYPLAARSGAVAPASGPVWWKLSYQPYNSAAEGLSGSYLTVTTPPVSSPSSWAARKLCVIVASYGLPPSGAIVTSTSVF